MMLIVEEMSKKSMTHYNALCIRLLLIKKIQSKHDNNKTDYIVILDSNHVSTPILCNFGISKPRSSKQHKIGMAYEVTKHDY